MRTAKWAALNRMEHPPVMVTELISALKTTRQWRDAMSLSEHMSKRAVESGLITASREERQMLGLAPGKRARRQRLSAKRMTSDLSTSGDVAQYLPFSSWSNAAPALDALVPIGPNGVSRMDSTDNQLAASTANKSAPTIAKIDVLDCTFGGGNHSRALLEEGSPFTRVVAMDCDLDVAVEADAIAREFGPKRFRFFGNHMSHALAMFGERKFDFIVIDPGPNAVQVFDPSRGFSIDLEHDHSLDMRYSAKTGTSALRWLEAEEIIAASTALSGVGLMDFRLAHLMMGYLRANRPLSGSLDVFRCLSGGRFGELPEDLWVSQLREKDFNAATKFMLSLRAVVNNELVELQSAVRDAMLLLRPHGHLAVITRHNFERKVVETALDGEPYCLKAFSSRVAANEVAEFGVPPSTMMSLYRLLEKPAALVKNGFTKFSDEEVARSSFSRMSGLQSTVPFGTHSFPSQNFTFAGVADEIEKAALRSNNAGPQSDEGIPRGERRRSTGGKFGPHGN